MLFTILKRDNHRSESLIFLRNQSQFAISLLLTIIILLLGAFFAVASNDDQTGKLVLLIAGIILSLSIASMFTVKFTGHSEASGHFIIFWISIIFLSIIMVTRGPLDSNVSPILLVPMVISFCMLGPRGGFVWCSLIAIIFIACSLIALNGYKYPQIIHTGSLEQNRFAIWVSTLTLFAFVLGNYEYLLGHLLKERGGSHSNLLRQIPEIELSMVNIDKLLLEEYVSEAINRNKRFGDKLAIHIIDFDMSHSDISQQSEALIRAAYRRIEHLIRRTDIVVRLSDQRLGIVLEHLSTDANHQGIIYNLNKILMRPYHIEEDGIVLPFSVKSYLLPDQNSTADNELKRIGYHFF